MTVGGAVTVHCTTTAVETTPVLAALRVVVKLLKEGLLKLLIALKFRIQISVPAESLEKSGKIFLCSIELPCVETPTPQS